MQVSAVIIGVGVLLHVQWSQCATIPFEHWRSGQIGYLELQPNGTLAVHNITEPQTAANAPPQAVVVIVRRENLLRGPFDKWMIKIYGDGVEYKFPLFLERIVQRVQSYFSVYKKTERPPYAIVVAADTINHGDGTATTSSAYSGAYTNEDYPEFIEIGETNSSN